MLSTSDADSLDGFDACATIWFRLIVTPESRMFMIVVTRKSFLATVDRIIKNFFVCKKFHPERYKHDLGVNRCYASEISI